MAVCKTCGKEYHACGSCGLQNWEYEFCSTSCWDKDPVKSRQLQLVYSLLDKVSNEEMLALFEMNCDDRGQTLVEGRIEEKVGRKLW